MSHLRSSPSVNVPELPPKWVSWGSLGVKTRGCVRVCSEGVSKSVGPSGIRVKTLVSFIVGSSSLGLKTFRNISPLPLLSSVPLVSRLPPPPVFISAFPLRLVLPNNRGSPRFLVRVSGDGPRTGPRFLLFGVYPFTPPLLAGSELQTSPRLSLLRDPQDSQFEESKSRRGTQV